MKISYKNHRLEFKRPAGTSRSVLYHNNVWIIRIEKNDKLGFGECNPLVGLSIDDREDFEVILKDVISEFEKKGKIDLDILDDYPAMKFGFESALLDLTTEGEMILFPSDFTKGKRSILINGLLWMGEKQFMLEQLSEKLKLGFNCIKLKIGAIDFEQEIDVLKEIRKNYSAEEIEIRVDANGAFTINEALDKLQRLSAYDIHSIEQPIAVGQWNEMEELCKRSPIPIALDEELIPLRSKKERYALIKKVKPDYIILKPSLLGGFGDCDEWITIAEEANVKWWLTSALESNIGLNSIAQYSFSKGVTIPQGLGTGGLYSNNYASPLHILNGELFYDPDKSWGKI